MAPFLFRCPNTAALVQHDSPLGIGDEETRYEAIECLACGLLHLVNPATGKLMSEEWDDPKP